MACSCAHESHEIHTSDAPRYVTDSDQLVSQLAKPIRRNGSTPGKRTLIAGGFLYAGDLASTVIPDAWVLVEADQIVSLGSMEQALPDHDVRIDAKGKLILPGFVNPHWHESFVAPNFERPDDRSMPPSPYAQGGNITALSSMFGFISGVGKQLSKGEGVAIARWSLWTQLRSGTTCLGDVGSANLPDAMAEAAIDLGLRMRISRWGSDIMIPDQGSSFVTIASAKEQYEDWLSIIEKWEGHASGLVGAMPSVMGAFGSSDQQLQYLADLKQAFPHVPYATHLAPLKNEATALRRIFGKTAIERFDDFGLLGPKLLAVHTAYASESEYQRLRETAVNICHAPAHYGMLGEATVSETKQIARFLQDGVWVSTSTDGDISFIGGMCEAMRGAHLGHNESSNDQRTCPPNLALRSGSLYGAKAMQWLDRIGSIEAGKQADLVLVNIDDYRYKSSPHPLRTFLVTGSSHDVDFVMVAGHIQIAGSQSTAFVEQELYRDYENAVASARKRIKPPH